MISSRSGSIAIDLSPLSRDREEAAENTHELSPAFRDYRLDYPDARRQPRKAPTKIPAKTNPSAIQGWADSWSENKRSATKTPTAHPPNIPPNTHQTPLLLGGDVGAFRRGSGRLFLAIASSWRQFASRSV